ncbi:MAG: hypothetical protein GEV07_17995 [Streptosporangiales bacterium]|nr:hypothetical protein [Streptosporangiales bacterium]
MDELSEDPVDHLELVRTRAGSGADPLSLVDIAASVSRDLVHAGDAVLEQFVREAHDAGCSWTAIGDRLGMTRQAARQRFGVAPMRLLTDAELEVRPRLQACLDKAHSEAEHDGCEEVDSQYLLLGLLHAGVAAAALDRLGVTPDNLRDAMRELFGAPTDRRRTRRAPELSDDAREAIDGAYAIARDRGQCYVGTEHLLFCLATDPGSQASRVLTRLDVDVASVKRELEGCLPLRARRIRRRRRGQSCSFCGKPASPTVRLVGGPGVCICDECVRKAIEQLPDLPR